MLSLREDQRGLFEADQLWLDHVGRNTFYGYLAGQRGELFKDRSSLSSTAETRAGPAYRRACWRPPLAPADHDRVSDEEARQRACFDVRWKVALGLEMESRPFAKSTLQLFRAQLILHELVRLPFERSLELARRRGFLKPERKLKLPLDTTAVLGQGAVKDTYNLLADGIRQLIWELAQQERQKPQRWAEKRGLGRYFGSSIKGEAELEWSDKAQREEFLGGLVADAERLLELARQDRGRVEEGSRSERRLLAASQLLSQLLLQDVERKPDGGAGIRQGTSSTRVPSVHDPEIRHGRKSKQNRFDGHKLGLAVDTEEQLITAVDVMAGSAHDSEDALQLVAESGQATGLKVEQVLADTAYGSVANRLQFQAQDIDLVAKVARLPERGFFSKDRSEFDWEAKTCKCPAGQVTANLIGKGRMLEFRFDRESCAGCQLRAQCYSMKSRRGRQVEVRQDEGVLVAARARQRSPDFKQLWRPRQVVEHRIARMVQLGMRQARYRGRQKTLFQALLTAAVANLTLVAGHGDRSGLLGKLSRARDHLLSPLTALFGAQSSKCRLESILAISVGGRPPSSRLNPAFRPSF